MTSFTSLTDAASELGKDAKESVEDFGRSAGKKVDGAREDTADALHTAASSVRSSGRQMDHLAAGTADKLDATASFVEDYELKDVFVSIRRFARRHLTESLVAAATIGLIAGVAVHRVAHSCARTPQSE